MPPKPKKTREEVIAASVELVRRNGSSALTARALGSALGVAPSSVFTHFASMEALERSTLDAIREIYEQYAARGLAMTPPFKGFGMELLRFAEEEPKLFSALFLEQNASADLSKLLEREGHRELILSTIADTFEISSELAERLYRFLWVYLCGMTTLLATGVCSFTEEERSEHLGNACRGFLLTLLAPEDQRVTLTPREGQEIEGSVESYIRT